MTPDERQVNLKAFSDAGLSPEEADLMISLADFWNRYLKLPPLKEVNDNAEVCAAVHSLQDKVVSRSVYRRYWESIEAQLGDAFGPNDLEQWMVSDVLS